MFIPCYRVTSEGLFLGIDMETKKMLYQYYEEPVPMVYGGIAYYANLKIMRNSERELTIRNVDQLMLQPNFQTAYMGLPYLIVPYCDKAAKIALVVTVQYVKDDTSCYLPVFNTHLVQYENNEDFTAKIEGLVHWLQKTSQQWSWFLNTGLLYYYYENYDNFITTGTNLYDIPYWRLLGYTADADLSAALKQLKRSSFMLGGTANTVVLKDAKNLEEAKHFSPVLSIEGNDQSAVMVRYSLQSGYTLVNHGMSTLSAAEIGYVYLRDVDSPFVDYLLYDNTSQVLNLQIASFTGRDTDNGKRTLELSSEYYPMELQISTEPPVNTTEVCSYCFDLRKCKYIRKAVIRAHFSYTDDIGSNVVDLRGVYCDSLYIGYIAQFDTVKLTTDTYMLRGHVLPSMHFLPLQDITPTLYGCEKLKRLSHRDKSEYLAYGGGIDRNVLKFYGIRDELIDGYESAQKMGNVNTDCGLIQAKHIEITITRNFRKEDLRLVVWGISYETCTIFYDSTKIIRETVNLFSQYLWNSRSSTVHSHAETPEFTLIDTAEIYPPSDSVKLVI